MNRNLTSVITMQDDMTRTKDLVPIREFANARSSIYTSSKWTPQIQLPTVWSGARWALQQLGLWSDDNSQGLSHGTADEEFVYVPMLKVCKPTKCTAAMFFGSSADDVGYRRQRMQSLTTSKHRLGLRLH